MLKGVGGVHNSRMRTLTGHRDSDWILVSDMNNLRAYDIGKYSKCRKQRNCSPKCSLKTKMATRRLDCFHARQESSSCSLIWEESGNLEYTDTIWDENKTKSIIEETCFRPSSMLETSDDHTTVQSHLWI